MLDADPITKRHELIGIKQSLDLVPCAVHRRQEHGVHSGEMLESVALEAGLDWREVAEKIATPEYKGRLRDNTDELIARGGFGSPTIFIDGEDMYFGNDRLLLVMDALAE